VGEGAPPAPGRLARLSQALGEALTASGAWRRHAPGYAALFAGGREALRERARDDLRALLSHAVATTPLYAERARAAGLDPGDPALDPAAALASLPRLTRRDVAERAGELRSSAFREDGALVPILTGGTTSEPLALWQDREAAERKDALTRVCRGRMGWVEGLKAAYLWGAAQDLPVGGLSRVKRAKEALLREWLPRAIFLPASGLDAARLESHARALERFAPAVLQAYPSAADLLARHLLERGRRLRIPLVVLTAEPVFEDQRARVADALGASVLSFYGARECGWIASECPERRRLHLVTPGAFVERAEDGALLVTDLLNRAMPLLRYEIGDRGRLADAPCPCGDPRPVLEEIEGRVVDTYLLPSGRRVPGNLADLRPARQGALGILDVQLVQEEIGRLTVNFVPAATMREEDLASYLAGLDRLFGGELEIRAVRVERLEPEANGKVRHGISRVRDGGAA
jgi:phenylacetate-CoA ligase